MLMLSTKMFREKHGKSLGAMAGLLPYIYRWKAKWKKNDMMLVPSNLKSAAKSTTNIAVHKAFVFSSYFIR